ncbi:MAG TPA: topoisomerase DNA-binding C4 zinc finger domain-containing protein [Anaerolineaceae bacterium]|nr:topoisomerase DNA-binding C4 zinc finger domain-containing protein [Anaerolineaceae bacterium]HPN54159.1 topoisomerase DNA-binding C4 zinc finger domain-containing protein [Anaerolineaceae bacterium]
MTQLRIPWSIIAGLWILYVLNVIEAYNEIFMHLLAIIAITLLINLWNTSAEKTEHETELIAQSKRIAETLDRIEKHLPNMHLEVLDSGQKNMPANNETAVKGVDPSPEQIKLTSPDSILCPQCQAPMVIRTVARGENQGKQFYVCSNYPKCKEVVPVK